MGGRWQAGRELAGTLTMVSARRMGSAGPWMSKYVSLIELMAGRAACAGRG